MADPATDESGSKLRDLAMAWRKVAVDTAIEQNPILKPSDFDGVEPDQIKTKAQETVASRKAEADELLRIALESRGVAVDSDLESALSTLTGGATPTVKDDGAAARLASVGSLGGSPHKPSTPVPESAKGKILAGLAVSKTVR